jgi:hypothetical protein
MKVSSSFPSAISLAETQALAEMAHLLHSFLPGSGAKYTWREAAAEYGLEPFWAASQLSALASAAASRPPRRGPATGTQA